MPQLFVTLSDGSSFARELEGIVTIGRAPDNLLVINESSVSSHHAKIDAGNSGVYLTDLFSSNGTCVNGEKIMTLKLSDGDRVRLGQVECVFTLAASA